MPGDQFGWVGFVRECSDSLTFAILYWSYAQAMQWRVLPYVQYFDHCLSVTTSDSSIRYRVSVLMVTCGAPQ